MSLSYKLLRSFSTVARQGSITAAAIELHVSQPALTQTMHQLEDLVGTPLMTRGARGIALTQAGREFLIATDHLIEQMDRALADIRDYAQLRRGSLSVAVLPSVASAYMPALIGTFKKQYPDLTISLHDALNEQIRDLVARGICDFGIMVASTEGSEFESQIIGSDEMALLCAKNHPLTRYKAVSWSQVSEHDFLSLSRNSSTRRMIEQTFASVGHFIRPVLEVQNIAAIGRMVEAGLGVTVVPKLVAPLIGDIEVAWVPLIKPRVDRKLLLVKSKGQILPPAAQAFWQFVLEHRSVFVSRLAAPGEPK